MIARKKGRSSARKSSFLFFPSRCHCLQHACNCARSPVLLVAPAKRKCMCATTSSCPEQTWSLKGSSREAKAMHGTQDRAHRYAGRPYLVSNASSSTRCVSALCGAIDRYLADLAAIDQESRGEVWVDGGLRVNCRKITRFRARVLKYHYFHLKTLIGHFSSGRAVRWQMNKGWRRHTLDLFSTLRG
jgi:hypothetical protein